MQLCALPNLHYSSLTAPGFIHALSGFSTQSTFNVGLMAIDSGTSQTLTLQEDSQVIIYIEAPEDVPVAV